MTREDISKPGHDDEPRAGSESQPRAELRRERASASPAVAEPDVLPSGQSSASSTAGSLSSLLDAEMRHVFDAMPDGVVITDNDGRIQLANRQTEQLFGYEASGLIGQRVERLMPERFHETHPTHRLHYAQSSRMRPMGTGLQLHGRRSDGSEFPLEISLSPISFADTPLVLAAIRDVTDQRLLEQRARQAVETRLAMLQSILDELPGSVYLAQGPDAKLVLANRQVAAVWGAEWSSGESMREFLDRSGARIFDLQGQDLPFERLATIRALRSGESVRQHQEIIRRADGTSMSVLVNAVALPLENFPILTHVASAENAVEDTASAREVGAMSEPAGMIEEPVARTSIALVVHQDVGALVEAERIKDEFVALAAHELRNPIGALLGYAQALIQAAGPLQRVPRPKSKQAGAQKRSRGREVTDTSAWQLEAVNEIMESSHRLAALTDDLLDVTRLQAQRLELRPEPLELGALVRRVARRGQVTTTKHTIMVTAPVDPVLVYADARRIEQVLTNLISNAVKYSPDGGPIEVTVRIAPTEPNTVPAPLDPEQTTRGERAPDADVKLTRLLEVARVSVHDHGMGIPEDQRHRIFTQFSRATNARESGIAGTGLGLYLSRELIMLHGGRMWFESIEGSGATFAFELQRIGVEE